ncbi:MAG: 4-hydroxy-tetrahydrodipicolinate synthase [Candidatus Omnitrophica bacterium]|nr:4-hydroxy-tetrahydrodipicolinate synthase [Candidatus Omnitrophota bacterium]
MTLTLRGSMVALVTPFKGEQVDVAALKRLVELHIDAGSSAIVPCGTTGESATLSFEEHERVIETVVQASRGRIPVIAGTGSNNTQEAIMLTKGAKQAGADAALLISPYYNKPTQRGLYLHFKAIAEAVHLPLVLYNIASRTAVNIEPDTIARLAADCPTIKAVKESSGNLEQMSRIMQMTKGRLELLSGDDALTLPVLSIGGSGVISVVANLVPKDVAAMVGAFGQGKIDEAIRLHYRLLPLTKAMFLETNPIPVKTAMARLGMIAPGLRLPLCDMEPSNLEKLELALEAYGLRRHKAAGSFKVEGSRLKGKTLPRTSNLEPRT